MVRAKVVIVMRLDLYAQDEVNQEERRVNRMRLTE